MTREEVKKLRNEANDALNAIFKKYNITGGIGNIYFNDSEIRFKVTAYTLTSNGNNTKKSETDRPTMSFELNAMRHGLDASAYNTKFEYGGKMWILKDFNNNAPMRPIIAENKNGTRYKLPYAALDNIKDALGMNK